MRSKPVRIPFHQTTLNSASVAAPSVRPANASSAFPAGVRVMARLERCGNREPVPGSI